MSLFDAFRYDGKRAVVVGGATGIGAAVAELVRDAGAEVVVLDYAEVTLSGVKTAHVNLADKSSIDLALEEVGTARVDALFSCAGVADGTPGIERINFVGHRYMVDDLLSRGALGRGSSVGFIASAAGLGWEANLGKLSEVLAISDFDEGASWFVDNDKADYFHTKQAVCAYVATQALPLLKRGIRVNAVCPGPTDTPLAQANKDTWLGFGADYRAVAGIEASTPLEQAYPLVFLCSDAGRAMAGQTVVSDAGYLAAGVTGAFPPATGVANFLLGRL